jgi:hypothetical protein
MSEDSILYKYRAVSAQSLALIINRELYFAEPKQLNDPFDFQLNISTALQDAIERAGTDTGTSVTEKLAKLSSIDHIYKKMESDIEHVGILSLSRIADSALMWTHYASEHKGFCLGFRLSRTFTKLNEDHLIVGCSVVEYFHVNPFYEYFVEFAKAEEVPEWNEVYEVLLAMGMLAKSKSWKHEKEVRVVRKESGTVPFQPEDLVEVIFGSRMAERDRSTIRKLLSGSDWKHVRFREVVKEEYEFGLSIVDS